jgi:acyl-CoA dehydrogenase
MADLPYERAIMAVAAVAAMEGGIEETLKYVKERQAFGQTLAVLQTICFKLAEITSVTRAARVFVDHCISKWAQGTLDTETAAMAQWWVTDMQQKALDECVQLRGRYGYMKENLVCRLFVDSRVQRIYGGANEIMKELISKSL